MAAHDDIKAQKTIRYTFRLTESENIEFLKRIEDAGYGENKSQYIVSTLLGNTVFPKKQCSCYANYLKKLADFHYQFQKIGNNYNQVLRVVHSRKTNDMILKKLDELILMTRQLKGIGHKVNELSNEMNRIWSQ